MTSNFLGEIEPAADTLIGIVEETLVVAVVAGLNDRKDSLGEVARIGGRPDLGSIVGL